VDSVIAEAGDDVEICLGDGVTLTASGGSSYRWSTGATTSSITVSPSQTSTYTVQVSDGVTEDTDEVTVSVSSVTADAGSDVSIESGSQITLTASGGESYQWSTGETTSSITVSPAQTTVYEVTVSNAMGCESTDQVQVSVTSTNSPVDSVIAEAGDDVEICLGDRVTLTASGGESYQWSTGATTSSITVRPLRTTKYDVLKRSHGKIIEKSYVVHIENCDKSIDRPSDFLAIELYPNPTEGIININVKSSRSERLKLQIVNLNGNLIYSNTFDLNRFNSFPMKFDLSTYSKGLYFLKIIQSNTIKTKKILLIK
jgi:carbamoylphosphate synthase small subunit